VRERPKKQSRRKPVVASTAPASPDAAKEPVLDGDKKQEALDLVMETVEALIAERGAEEKIWGSMVKQALKRRMPGFNESYYGFRSFSKLLDEAEARKLLTLEHDEKSGGVIVKSFNADY
jgi:OST-HTH/LOTUS domain-containing protein